VPMRRHAGSVQHPLRNSAKIAGVLLLTSGVAGHCRDR
jgi:hypothetical protein